MTFTEIVKENFPLLEQYTPILARVHGGGHPELAEVRDIFQQMNDKVKNQAENEMNLSAQFEKLRAITNNYSVPSDGCGTYLETYNMLAEADKVYHQ